MQVQRVDMFDMQWGVSNGSILGANPEVVVRIHALQLGKFPLLNFYFFIIWDAYSKLIINYSKKMCLVFYLIMHPVQYLSLNFQK